MPHGAFAQTTNETVTVSEIAISGNSRVSDSTISAYLPVRVGDAISEDSLDNAIDSLFATKLFNDVTINIEGTRISIAVVENPIVNRVNIEGNDVLDDERLLAELDIQPRRVFTRKVAVDATQKLLEIYRLSGRYAAEITPQVIRLDNNRVDLIFEVDEGPLIKVTSISFIGNETFSDFALRQVISSRQVRWWAFLSSVDKYDESRLDYDARLLRQFYLGRGYANIEIKRAQGGLLADRSGFALTFEIDEGTRYKLRDVSFTSQITDIDVSKFRDDIPLEKGDWYNVKGLEQGLLNVTNSLGNLGYAFVDVRPQVTPDTDSNELDIEISIGEGRKNYIERIEVVNNSRTMKPSDSYLAQWFNRKIQTDFGFQWVRFQYMGLNSQTQGLQGTTHADCSPEDEWNLSFLYYTNKFWNKEWGGSLRFYDEMQQGIDGRDEHIKNHQIGEVEFKPNRLLMFDGRIPHGADAPSPKARYIDRKSIVLRGDEIRLIKDTSEWFHANDRIYNI